MLLALEFAAGVTNGRGRDRLPGLCELSVFVRLHMVVSCLSRDACMGRLVSPFIVEREGGLQRRERREKEEKEEREKQKDGMVYGVVPLLLASPLGHAGDGDVRHPGVLFVTGVTCALGQSRRGASFRDRSWRSQIANGDASRTTLGRIVTSYSTLWATGGA